MDKETQDAFKNIHDAFDTLTKLMVKEFKTIRQDMAGMATKDDIKNMATKDDIKNMATKDDIKNMATKDDIKELKDELRTIVREEVQDIREAIEERCNPARIG